MDILRSAKALTWCPSERPGRKRLMSRFLFTTLPTNDLGLLTRSLPIAAALASRGHSVTFCSPARAPSRLIADAGFQNRIPNHPLYALIAHGATPRGLLRLVRSGSLRRYGSPLRALRDLVLALPLRSPPRTHEIWNVDHAGAQLGMLNEGFVRANCAAMLELIASSDVDVVVDFWNPFAVLAARALRKPVVTVIQADAHPRSAGFIWWKQPPADLPTPVPVLNRVLASYGLPPIRSLSELSVGDLTLCVGMPETDPLPADAAVTYVGPILWQKPEASLPAWIAELSSDTPLIWLYAGNPRYGSADELLDSAIVLRASIAALRDEKVHLIITTGHHPLPRDLLPLPANVRHEAYLPGLAMAERSDLLIHHGGYGSCQTGLLCGKPAVIVPTYAERESNARRVAALGAAALVPVTYVAGKKYVDVAELRAAVRRVLAEPSFTANAKRASERLRSYGGTAAAAVAIEQFAHQHAVR